MSKKQPAKIAQNKPKPLLHEDDWNSRFWIGKIPDYKPKSAVYPERPDLKSKFLPIRLPKIQSAHVLPKNRSPVIDEIDTLTTFKQENENSLKLEPILEALVLTKSESVATSKPGSKLDNKKPDRQASRKFTQESGKSSTARPSNRPSKIQLEELKKSELAMRSRSSHILPDEQKVSAKKNNKVKNAIEAGRPSYLKYLPKLSQHESSNMFSINPDNDELYDTFQIKEDSSESEEDEAHLIEQKIIIAELCEAFINGFIDGVNTQNVVESIREMFSAALVLFSSSVLDKYIIEVLSQMIPKIAKEVYNESTVIEYIDLRDKLVSSVFNEELQRIVYNLNLHQIASKLMKSYAYVQLPLNEIIEEAIIEEKALNKEIVQIMGNHLIDCLIEEEWVEVLVEDEINSMRIEQIWKVFPANLQKEIGRTHLVQIVERIAEHVYFDYLNDFVIESWIKEIVKLCLEAASDDKKEAKIHNPQP